MRYFYYSENGNKVISISKKEASCVVGLKLITKDEARKMHKQQTATLSLAAMDDLNIKLNNVRICTTHVNKILGKEKLSA